MTTISAEQQISFLQSRISEIKTARFYNLSDSVLKFPTAIVSTHKVDEYGFVWFFMPKPKQQLEEFEKEFPVRLEFFRKGTGGHMEVCGKAWLVTDPEELNFTDGVDGNAVPADMILMKVKVSKADYFEVRDHKATWLNSAASTFMTWFRNPSYRPATTYLQAS